MGTANLAHLDTWDPKTGSLNVVIETPKGCRSKLEYEPDLGLFELSKVLPRGAVFPFDFGFIPSTVGDDGDPLDVLILMDEPLPPGCKVTARLIGVIEAEQTEDGQIERNDRLLAVADHCHDFQGTRSIKDLKKSLTKEIEHFFVSYNEMAGKRFKPIGCRGPRRAERLVQDAAKRLRANAKSGSDGAPTNGRQKAGKG
jgi:inorganic pyrophosphatase